MQTSTKLGMNRTGVQMSPIDMKKMQAAAAEAGGPIESPPPSAIREQYLVEADGDSVGSVPIPTSLNGVLESAKEMFTGHRPQVLIDKLGERLAFERSGVRLYEALLTKCQLNLDDLPVDMFDKLSEFKEEELQHFKLVHDVMLAMGADPTAITPCANLIGVESMGLIKVVVDSRTTVPQSLHAILGAELIDNAGWESLVDLAAQLKQDDLVAQFQQALNEENQHLVQVKNWLQNFTAAEALRENPETVRH